MVKRVSLGAALALLCLGLAPPSVASAACGANGGRVNNEMSVVVDGQTGVYLEAFTVR
ncbi:hypothetical protein [Kribbella ginsengisoli]